MLTGRDNPASHLLYVLYSTGSMAFGNNLIVLSSLPAQITGALSRMERVTRGLETDAKLSRSVRYSR